jgi:hypothetical protein
MPLATFVSFIKISSRSFILNLRKPKYCLMAVAMIILTGVQTAGYVIVYAFLVDSHRRFTYLGGAL